MCIAEMLHNTRLYHRDSSVNMPLPPDQHHCSDEGRDGKEGERAPPQKFQAPHLKNSGYGHGNTVQTHILLLMCLETCKNTRTVVK